MGTEHGYMKMVYRTKSNKNVGTENCKIGMGEQKNVIVYGYLWFELGLWFVVRRFS